MIGWDARSTFNKVKPTEIPLRGNGQSFAVNAVCGLYAEVDSRRRDSPNVSERSQRRLGVPDLLRQRHRSNHLFDCRRCNRLVGDSVVPKNDIAKILVVVGRPVIAISARAHGWSIAARNSREQRLRRHMVVCRRGGPAVGALL